MMAEFGTYKLLDCGNSRKLEQLGPIVVDRSAPPAQHPPKFSREKWKIVDARHVKATVKNENHRWELYNKDLSLKDQWPVAIGPLVMNCKLTDFGHIGFFPEQASQWPWLIEVMSELTMQLERAPRILNLFGHTGGSSLALAIGGAHVTHVDSSKSAIAQGKDNQALNSKVPADSIRWIQDDCLSFLEKELRRDSNYDGVVLDPPSYGKGVKKGQSFKIENSLEPLLQAIAKLTKKNGLKLLHFSCHTLEFDNTRIAELCARHFSIALDTLEEKALSVPTESGAKALSSGNCVRLIK